MLDLPHRFSFDNGGIADRIAWGVIGDGPPLIAVHGTPFSAQVWRRIAPVLAHRFKVFYFDLLGYGASDKRDGQNVSLAVQNRLLAALVAHWQIARPTVLAHDFGGATALRAHYLDGLDYGRLILVDPVAISPWGSPFVQHVRRHEAAFTGLPDYTHEALLGAYLGGAAATALSGDVLGIYRAPWTGVTGKPAFYRQIAQMDRCFTDEIEDRYRPPDFPVTLLWGREDAWIPIEQGRRLADRLTGGVLQEVDGAGHLVQEDRPESIVAAVLG